MCQNVSEIAPNRISMGKVIALTKYNLSEKGQTFFATVQNKLHFAMHGQTASELIVDRADL